MVSTTIGGRPWPAKPHAARQSASSKPAWRYSTALRAPCLHRRHCRRPGHQPGNLYYHYRAKDEIVNALFAQYEQALGELLQAGGDVADVEDAWFFTHRLFELVWQYRLYQDLNNLLSRNRQLETQFPALLRAKTQAMHALLAALGRSGALRLPPDGAAQTTANCMVLVLTG